MTTLERSQQLDLLPMESESMLSAAGSRVRILVMPETAKGSSREPVAAYGFNSDGLLANYDRNSSLWRTSQRCFIEGWEPFSETWPRSGMTRNGIAWMLSTLECRNIGRVCGLSPIPHERVATRYFLKMPSMLRAIDRGYMDKVQTMPTLTTKIVDRAPCPYWETSNGPRYLTESEAEIMSGFPLGWTDINL